MLQVKGKCVRVINIRELILIFIIIYSFISLASCSKESPVESRKQLIGEFRLNINTNIKLREDYKDSKLFLYEDGTSMQECIYNKDEHILKKSTWNFDDNTRSLWIENFVDCAGVWPINRDQENGANLTVEFSSTPLLILSPDINVFYEKVQNRQ